MKQIILLRHGYSQSAAESGSDRQRALDDRGIRQISVIAKKMAAEGLLPGYLISSSAKRARMSAEIIKESLSLDMDIKISPRLYSAKPPDYLEILRSMPDIYSSVMIVAHNPVMEDVVSMITARKTGMGTAELFTAELGIDSWRDLKIPGTPINLSKFLRPEE